MREEMSEPQQWRSSRLSGAEQNSSWTVRRKASERTQESTPALANEAVDAAFADESIVMESVRGSRRDLVTQGSNASAKTPGSDNLLQDISTQLAMLQTQQEHLQQLLDQVQD